MKIDIDHREETTGWISKTTHYVVDLTVTFSEEEKQIIKDRKIEDVIVVERGVPSNLKVEKFAGMDDIFNLTIGKLAKGKTDSYAFSTPVEAKEYDALLREKMPELKAYITENAAVENKHDSFEL